ncbi:MAG: hypothetical protein ACI8RZ_001475 [Myxococcota bacterium]
MKFQRTNPLYEEVALSGEGFGDDDIGRGRGGRGGGGRRGPARGRGGRGAGGRGGPRGGRGRRLQPREDEETEESEELAGRKQRKSRRNLRKKQRGQRKNLRSKQQRGGSKRAGKRGGRRGGQSSRDSARPSSRPSRSRTPDRSGMPGAADQALDSAEELEELPVEEWEDTADEWDDEDEEWDDDDWDDLDEMEDDALEGAYAELGAAVDVGRLSRGDARRIFSNVKANIAKKRQSIQARRRNESPRPGATAPTAPTARRNDGWGPVAKLGTNIRIQAGNGHRAAVMELRPGLWIVADVKHQTTLPTTEGGIGVAILPALMARGAANALHRIVKNRRENGGGGGGRLWQRNQRNNPVLNPPTQPHLAPMSQPLQLAGPIAENIGNCCKWARKEDL